MALILVLLKNSAPNIV